jgi:RND family efflux transporter MFP subunit
MTLPKHLFRPRGVVRLPAALLLAAVALAAAACGADGAAAPGTPGGAPPFMAMGVEAVTLAPRPVERTTEYIATVRSRRSTRIQPQVDGLVTAIHARPGQRVRPGTPILDIDSDRQQALVASLESMRAAREADLAFARQQLERMETLYEAGAVSRQEYEQAVTALRTSEAQLKAVEAQIREQRVELAYHRVTAPTAGVLGDIPVRVGDRVTPATVLTTIDENAGLELYINVPMTQAPQLAQGLRVRVVDDEGQTRVETALNFIAPSVDPATQSVLVKAPLPEGEQFRVEQFTRALIVWDEEERLTVPLVAVSRINGQHFVFVAESGEGGQLVARQRAVRLGPVVGNDYVVLEGLRAGERLIVSGVQKIADGVPVTILPPGGAAQPPARGAEGR